MPYSKPLNLLDLSFVLMETRQTPMHVAGLQTFVPPPDATRDFPKQVYEYLRSFPVTAPPFNYRLRGVGPGRLLPVFEEVDKVDLDDALAFYQDRFGDASDFTFVVVGNVDPDQLRPLVETYLASLPAKGRKEKEKDVGVRRVGGVVKKGWNLNSEPKATVSIAFHGNETWSRDKERDMFVLSEVVSMRLREVLREDMGGVYGVGAGGFLTRRPRQERTFSIRFGCAPEAADKLIQAAFDELAVIGKTGIGDDYLAKVKEQWLRDRETQMKSNGFWVRWLSSTARFGDDPLLVLDPSKMVGRMTSANVKAAAKRYLSTKQYYQALLLPAAK